MYRHARTTPNRGAVLEGETAQLASTLVEKLSSPRQHLLLVTGAAGTGKSTLTRTIASELGNAVLLAPTAVAALTIGGSTIHKAFGIPPITIDADDKQALSECGYGGSIGKVFRNASAIILDEISMVPANLIDVMDQLLRATLDIDAPFGGVSVMMVGDSYQLSPIVRQDVRQYYQEKYGSEHFFNARVFGEVGVETIELTKVYRQTDDEFLHCLHAIRSGGADSRELREALAWLNDRCVGEKPAKQGTLRLVTHNNVADNINSAALKAIDAPELVYEAKLTGKLKNSNDARLPAPREIRLKEGAEVVFIRNGADWNNGECGRVIELDEEAVVVEVNGKEVRVTQAKWELMRYSYSAGGDGVLSAESDGKIQQLPLMLGWAMTIHRSQSMTLERVHLELARRRSILPPGNSTWL